MTGFNPVYPGIIQIGSTTSGRQVKDPDVDLSIFPEHMIKKSNSDHERYKPVQFGFSQVAPDHQVRPQFYLQYEYIQIRTLYRRLTEPLLICDKHIITPRHMGVKYSRHTHPKSPIHALRMCNT